MAKTKAQGSDEFNLEAFTSDMTQWWDTESADWDLQVAGEQEETNNVIDLYDDLPEIDSKAVARTSPIFEQHFGIPLDTSLIKPGGYSDISSLISDLVPKMKKILEEKQ